MSRQSRTSQIQFKGATEYHQRFKETLTLFFVKALIDEPKDIIGYAANYFQNLKIHRKKSELSRQSSETYNEDPNIEDMARGRTKVVYAESYNPEEAVSDVLSSYVDSKTSLVKDILRPKIAKCLLFRNLDEEHLNQVMKVMIKRETTPGEVIMKQGDEGDNFYVVESGLYEAYMEENGEQKLVNIYNNNGEFGELALMYNQPRAATVISSSPGSLWALSRQHFRKIVLKGAYEKRKRYETFLGNVPMLKPLEAYERSALADALIPMYFKDGENIIRQDDESQGMFFVESGSVTVSMAKNDDSKKISTIGEGGYFGEMGLVLKNPRAATVKAVGKVKLAFLDVEVFERLLGPCLDIMKREFDVYKQQVDVLFEGDEGAVAEQGRLD